MDDDSSVRDAPQRFPPTRTSAVLGVQSGDPAERARAFDILVRAYWKPVYRHIRVRWRRAPSDAGDLTQEFFSRAFEKRAFTNYAPERSAFRSYLKASLDRFLSTAARERSRQKRGGGAVRLSLDFDVAEAELQRLGPPNPHSTEDCFDAEWTRSLLASTVEALEVMCAEQGKQAYFAVFRRYVLDADVTSEAVTYKTLADELGLAVTDVTNYLAWSRREFRRLALAKVRELTSSEEEFRQEVRVVLGTDP